MISDDNIMLYKYTVSQKGYHPTFGRHIHSVILLPKTSGYATWFTAGGTIRIAHYDVIADVITRKP